MTSDEQGYQGWKNYETWAAGLWIDNEQSLYLHAIYEAEEASQNAANDPNVLNGVWTEDEAKRYRLADALQEWVSEELIPDLGATLAADLVNAAVSEIDWHELADHYLER